MLPHASIFIDPLDLPAGESLPSGPTKVAKRPNPFRLGPARVQFSGLAFMVNNRDTESGA